MSDLFWWTWRSLYPEGEGIEMARDEVEARGLVRVRVEPALDKETARILILEDTADQATGYIINPEGLRSDPGSAFSTRLDMGRPRGLAS